MESKHWGAVPVIEFKVHHDLAIEGLYKVHDLGDVMAVNLDKEGFVNNGDKIFLKNTLYNVCNIFISKNNTDTTHKIRAAIVVKEHYYNENKKLEFNVEWRDAPGYEGYYQINNFGDIKNIKKDKLCKIYIRRYKRVSLTMNKQSKGFEIHQLVAMAFLGHKPDGCRAVVNHIDNDPHNNSVANLEIISGSKNSKLHARRGAYIGVFKKYDFWVSRVMMNNKYETKRFNSKWEATQHFNSYLT